MEKRKVVIRGVEYESILSACKAMGKEGDYNKILNRINYGGWSLEEAFEVNDRKRGAPVRYRGVEYKNLRELCEKTGFKYGTVRQQVYRGKTVEEALGE